MIDYAPDPDLVREILKEESVDLILLIEHQHGDEDVAFFALHNPNGWRDLRGQQLQIERT